MPSSPRLLCLTALWRVPLMVGLLGTWPLPAAPAAEPLDVAQAADVALNAHDAAAVMALLADGGTVQGDQAPQAREQVRGWIEQLIDEDVGVALVGQPRVEAVGQPAPGTRVRWPARLALDRFRALGLDAVAASFDVVVVDGRITRLSVRPDPGWPALAGRPDAATPR